MAAESNLSGTSLYSELFASEMPHRCEGAKLLKTESKIVYATMSKMTDLLVEIDGEKSSVAPEDAWKKHILAGSKASTIVAITVSEGDKARAPSRSLVDRNGVLGWLTPS